MNKLVEIYCDVDDFCRIFVPKWEKRCLTDGSRKRRRQGRMTSSEVMTLIILFHRSHYRDFKNFYLGYVQRFLRKDFPQLLSYTRFLEVMPRVVIVV